MEVNALGTLELLLAAARNRWLSKMARELRLPMVPVAPETQKQVRAAMIHAGLLN